MADSEVVTRKSLNVHLGPLVDAIRAKQRALVNGQATIRAEFDQLKSENATTDSAILARLEALELQFAALASRVTELENRPVPSWLHTPKRNAQNLISEILSEPIED